MTNSEDNNTTHSGQVRGDDVYEELYTSNTGDGAGLNSTPFEFDALGNLVVDPPSVSGGGTAIGHTITKAYIDRLPAFPGESLVGEQKPAGTPEHGQSDSRNSRSAKSAAGSTVARSSLPDNYEAPITRSGSAKTSATDGYGADGSKNEGQSGRSGNSRQ
jgi:hypothetical protein